MPVRLVVVSGAPGTGKSTVAAAVAADLGWPLLSLDTVKETLADVLGLGDQDWSDRAGNAAAEVIFRLSHDFPQVVAEGWWRRDRRDRATREFARALEVFCECSDEVAVARMRARLGTGRHPIHRDVLDPGLIGRGTGPVVTPLGLGGGLVRVDTEAPDAVATALAAVRSALHAR